MAATVAINPTVDIPVISCRPWAGHASGEELFYADILEESHEVVIVNESIEYPGPWAYQRRNEYMVDRGDMVLAVWDGENRGGTYNCVKYAKKQHKDIYWINPVDKEIKWLLA